MGLEEIRKLKEQASLPKPKKYYQIPRKSAKKIAMEKLEIKIEFVKTTKKSYDGNRKGMFELDEAGILGTSFVQPKGNAGLQRWFEDRHKEMVGVCKNCGCKTQRGKENYKNSIAHIFPKAYFKSVATHPDNWIELCFYGNSCHTNMDNKTLDLIEMNCWAEIVEKATRIYPSIAANERRRIPPILLEYIKTEL